MPPREILPGQLQALEHGQNVFPGIVRRGRRDNLRPRAWRVAMPDQFEHPAVRGSNTGEAQEIEIVAAGSKPEAKGFGEVLRLSSKDGDRVPGIHGSAIRLSVHSHHRCVFFVTRTLILA